MLDALDLSRTLDEQAYAAAVKALQPEIAALQRAVHAHAQAVVLVVEGLTGAGKGDGIAHLVGAMDPRGFKVHATRAPGPEEALRPPLWRFWQRLPERGVIAIFDQSWHHELLAARLSGALDAAGWERAVQGIKEFERQLTDDGAAVIKLWLHVSQREQKRRLKAWRDDPYQRWRLALDASAVRAGYKKTLPLVEELLALTHTHNAPWLAIEADHDLHRRVRLLREAAGALRRALQARGVAPAWPPPADAAADSTSAPHPDPLAEPAPAAAGSTLARIDLSLALPRPAYRRELPAAQARLRELAFACYAHRRGAVIVFEGWDAAGKGSAIKRLTERLDPRGYEVIPIAAPRGEEAARHYLWRFWRQIPKAGHLAIFDRSWYGRVLVERVEGFASEPAWRRAYQEINEFERALAAAGLIVVKFWLQISPEEQLRRFREREQNPAKRHKITAEDWRNRVRLPLYQEAVSEMLRQTSTPAAPWTIVEAEDKPYARVKVLRTVIAALEKGLPPARP